MTKKVLMSNLLSIRKGYIIILLISLIISSCNIKKQELLYRNEKIKSKVFLIDTISLYKNRKDSINESIDIKIYERDDSTIILKKKIEISRNIRRIINNTDSLIRSKNIQKEKTENIINKTKTYQEQKTTLAIQWKAMMISILLIFIIVCYLKKYF